MLPRPGGAMDGKWSARFPVYMIDFTNVAAGKRIATSKRRIRFRFGFSNAEAIDSGKTGTACRGSEHEVTLVWSISSGKRLILADGHEVHYSTVRSNVFEHSWTMRGNRVLKLVAHAVAPNSPSGQQQYDLSIDGQSFWHMPKVYELGIKGPSAAMARTPGVISAAERAEVSAPKSAQQEKDDLQKAIQASLEESREHLKRTAISADNKPAAPPTQKAAAPAPAAATHASRGLASGDLLDFGFEATAPAPAPATAVVPSSAPAPYASPDDLFGVPAPVPTSAPQVAAAPDPFFDGSAPTPVASQTAAAHDPFLGGPVAAPAPAEAVAAPNPFLDGPAPTPTPTNVASAPAPDSVTATPFDNSLPATQTAVDPFASQTAPVAPVAPQAAAPQGSVDPFAPQPTVAAPTGAPPPPAPQPATNDLTSSILSAYGAGEPKATLPHAPEQLIPTANNGVDTDKNSDAQPPAGLIPTSTTAPPEQKDAEPVAGLDSAMNKLVDFDDIFGQKEEPPPLSMNPFGETGKEQKETKDSSGLALSFQSGPQPTLAEMKTVQAPTERSSSIMQPAATDAGTLIAPETQQNANFGGYGHGHPSLSQAQGLAVGGQMPAAAPIDPFGGAATQPNQTQAHSAVQPQMPVQQQQQPQPQPPQPTPIDPFAGF